MTKRRLSKSSQSAFSSTAAVGLWYRYTVNAFDRRDKAKSGDQTGNSRFQDSAKRAWYTRGTGSDRSREAVAVVE